ncbi:hypothetical protein BJ741DRAFT_623153 [Chytriomyces cf. hyalinus JEL632]|nr:hypothetical protein BJ741DRAFT_623153 [Chytriomyces cf. hyalinus JEL632]
MIRPACLVNILCSTRQPNSPRTTATISSYSPCLTFSNLLQRKVRNLKRRRKTRAMESWRSLHIYNQTCTAWISWKESGSNYSRGRVRVQTSHRLLTLSLQLVDVTGNECSMSVTFSPPGKQPIDPPPAAKKKGKMRKEKLRADVQVDLDTESTPRAKRSAATASRFKTQKLYSEAGPNVGMRKKK